MIRTDYSKKPRFRAQARRREEHQPRLNCRIGKREPGKVEVINYQANRDEDLMRDV